MDIKKLKETYQKGQRIKCISMEDSYAVPPGTIGTIDSVDDIGTIHVSWDNGSSLGLIPNVDLFELI